MAWRQTLCIILLSAVRADAQDAPLSEAEVLTAQQNWGNALVNISTIFDEQGLAAAKAEAERVIDAAYGYSIQKVLFKPTLAYGADTFRTTRAGALAYFVGDDPTFPKDTGFALKHWRTYSIENAAVFVNGQVGTTVGNVTLTDWNGTVTRVEKTWTFYKDPSNTVRIMGHHSSLPYMPTVSQAEVEAAQKAWGDALVAISTIYDEQGFAAAKAKAEAVIDAAYGYNIGPVLFKPTLAYGADTFRTTRAGALSYFVGKDSAFPMDTGFALKHWRQYSISNAAVYRSGQTATTVGNVTLTDRDGGVTRVEKTWTFTKDASGKLRIMGHHSSLPFTPTVTQAEVEAAQKAWGDALVSIASIYDTQGLNAAKAKAEGVIDAAYGYQIGSVLFKPTLAYGNYTFRPTRAGALAYFVGNDPNFPTDTGFALKGWRKVDIVNSGIFLDGRIAMTMGNVILTDKAGVKTTVDKTWTFVKDAQGNLRIMAHHSSLPYTPPLTAAPREVSGTVETCSRRIAALIAVSLYALVSE